MYGVLLLEGRFLDAETANTVPIYALAPTRDGKSLGAHIEMISRGLGGEARDPRVRLSGLGTRNTCAIP